MLTPTGQGTARTSPAPPASPSSGTLRIDEPSPIRPPHFSNASRSPASGAVLTRHAGPVQVALAADAALGFLTVVDIPDKGYVGGFLVTNLWGKPLEFQCTTPVKPNNAQRILYGATLEPFVFGELIAPALLSKVTAGVALVLSNQQAVLAVRPQVNVGVACITRNPMAACSISFASGRNTTTGDCRWDHQCHRDYAEDENTAVALLDCKDRLDQLDEPFERIRLCIEEVYP